MKFNLPSRTLTLQKGVYLEEECAIKACILYLESGCINVSITLPNGKWIPLRRVNPGEFFSLSSFVTPSEHLSFETLSPVTVLCIPKEDFFQYTGDHPEFLKYYMSSIHDRVHFLLEKVILFSIQNNKQRMAYYFINEVNCQKSHIITIDMNKTCILECLGMSRGSFYRELNTLTLEGSIKQLDANTYECDLEQLNKAFSEDT